MKRLFKMTLLFLLMGLMLALGGFLGLALYYRNNFPVNTWINGVYCTGKTVEQVNEELSRQTEEPMVTIVGLNGERWQLMYYYMDGELVLDTDVVTGHTGLPVKYWMPVKGNVGIHDADWRAKFGGEIYKTNGSHGCINTPPKIMAQLYELVEIGTPVIMFY